MTTDYAAMMKVPGDKTCSDCMHCNRCVALGYSKPNNTSCDFYPNRFTQELTHNSRVYASQFKALVENNERQN